MLFAPYVRFHIFILIKVTDWPPFGKIAAHTAYDMFHIIYKYEIVTRLVFPTLVFGVGISF